LCFFSLNLLSSVIPLPSILTHHPVVQPVEWKGFSLESIQTHWLANCLKPIYWLNILYPLRQQNQLLSLTKSIISNQIISIEMQEQGMNGCLEYKWLSYAALLLPLRQLILHEKKKDVFGIGIILRESLKMENTSVMIGFEVLYHMFIDLFCLLCFR